MQTDTQQQNELGTAPVGRLLLRLALPNIAAQIVNMLYNIVDRIYIGHIPEIGSQALTGVGVTFPIIILISAFSSLIGMGGTPHASIAMGQQHNDRAEKIMGNCFSALITISVILTVVFLLTQRQILVLFGASEDTLPYALEYLNIYVLGTIFTQITLGMNGFITTQGKAKTAMLTVLIGAALNIILDPVFMFGFGMGVRGAAIATVFSQFISAIWVIRFLTGRKAILKLRKKNLRPEAKILLPVIGLGLSPFVMQSTESLLSITFNVSLAKYGGDLAVGAMTILTSLLQMVNLPLTGLTQGAQPIISYNFGARQVDRMKKAIRLLVTSAFLYGLFCWALTRTVPGLLVSLFTTDPDLQEFTIWALGIYMAVVFVLGIQTSFQQAFIALGEAKVSLFLALLRKVILLIPLILLLPNFFSDKIFAVFLAEPVSDFLAATTTTLFFLWRVRKIIAGLQTDRPAKKS